MVCPSARKRQPPEAKRIDVTRAEFDRVVAALDERADMLVALRRDLDMQFKRIAELQAAIDRVTVQFEKFVASVRQR